MNLAKIYQFSGAGLLAISLTLMSLTSSVKAQTNVESDLEPNTVVVEEDGFDWGWLGLLGLLGLGGLAGKSNNSDRHEVRNTEPFPETTERTR